MSVPVSAGHTDEDACAEATFGGRTCTFISSSQVGIDDHYHIELAAELFEMPLTQQQLDVTQPASEKLKDLRAEHLLSCLNQVAADFPAEVLNRGINRNWNDYRYILAHLADVFRAEAASPANYLDLGSGAGVVPLVMALAGMKTTAVDTWNEYAEEFENLMGTRAQFAARFDKYGVEWVEHDLCRPPLPFSSQSFDMISLFAVLEHLPRPSIVLDEILRILRPNGLLVITVPNAANLRNRLRLLFGRTPHPDDIETWFGPVFFGHYREMTKQELTRALQGFGFSIVTAEHTSACHWNTRLPHDRWDRRFRLISWHQWAKLFYLLVTFAVPSFRYEIFVVARKNS
jgi:SAM-dependent methyltransferase